jgi:NAD(P)-dependent dehydrogenase (short-subunit alcohol dehydrogenase family)
MNMQKSIQLVVLAAILVLTSLVAQPAVAGDQKAVLITGASTGIGRNMAERLAKEGYFVYAGARKDKDLAELDAIENVKAVRLDVTRQDDIDAAVATVRKEGRGLWGLINNAGVASSGPVAFMDDADLDFVLNVNVNGVVRVTRAFIPLIVESKGRIVTTGSISGILSSANGAAYSMSKHAMEALVDSLAKEMADTGVSVSVIEPGSYKSMIRRTTVARIRKSIEASGGDLTDEMKAQMQKQVDRETTLPEPDAVSDAAMHALFSDEPRRRYMVVPNQFEAEITIRKIIEELVQLNEGHEFSYDRDELVEMLDAAMNPQPASD